MKSVNIVLIKGLHVKFVESWRMGGSLWIFWKTHPKFA